MIYCSTNNVTAKWMGRLTDVQTDTRTVGQDRNIIYAFSLLGGGIIMNACLMSKVSY